MSESGPSRSERRRHPRSVVGIPVELVLRNLPEQHPNRVMGLRVTDLSRGGAKAVSHCPLPRAEPVTLFFPPRGPSRGEDASGRIVRCEERENRWEVGIAFEAPGEGTAPAGEGERIPAS